MSSKFFDIPFRKISSDSDFICKDGEIFLADNVIIKEGQDTAFPYLEGLDTHPPVPEVDFALVRTTLPGWHIHPDNYPVKTLPASDPSMEYWTKLGAQLLSQFRSEADMQNKFVSPFYAMAVWKTVTGHYLSPSLRQLMTPNSAVPLVATDGEITAKELEFKIAGAVCDLYIKMRAPEILRDWVGKIASLELLVSNNLHSYDSFQAFLPSKHVTTDSYCESLDLSTGVIAKRRICTDTLSLAWKANTRELRDEIQGIKYYCIASIPLGEVDLYEDWKSIGDKGFGIRDYGFGINDEGLSMTCAVWGTGEEMRLVTRPIKLSGAGELKKVRWIALRGNYDPSKLTVTIHASRDMMQWWPVAKRKGGTVLFLPHSSFRFYKIEISGHLAETQNLQGLSFS